MRRFCKVVPGIAKFGKRGICYYSYSSLTCHLGVDIINSTICPSGSGALRSQTWLRKIDARSCVELFSYQTTRRNFLRRLCEAISGFAKTIGQNVDCCTAGWSPSNIFSSKILTLFPAGICMNIPIPVVGGPYGPPCIFRVSYHKDPKIGRGVQRNLF